MIDSFCTSNPPLFITISETPFKSGPVTLTRCAITGSRLFCLHGNGCWVRTPITAAIISMEFYVTALHKVSLEGANLVDIVSNLDFPSDTRFTLNNIAF